MSRAPGPARRKAFKVERNLRPVKETAKPAENTNGDLSGLASQLMEMSDAAETQHQDLLGAIESMRAEMFTLAHKEPNHCPKGTASNQ